MTFRFAGTVPLLFLAACTTASAPKVGGTPFSLSEKQIAAVKRDLPKSLKDPESARFGTISAARSNDGRTYVCGYVNAKNSFGGYTGEQPFIGTLFEQSGTTTFLTIDVGGDQVKQSVTRQFCEGYGVVI